MGREWTLRPSVPKVSVEATIRKIRTVQTEGNCQVDRERAF